MVFVSARVACRRRGSRAAPLVWIRGRRRATTCLVHPATTAEALHTDTLTRADRRAPILSVPPPTPTLPRAPCPSATPRRSTTKTRLNHNRKPCFNLLLLVSVQRGLPFVFEWLGDKFSFFEVSSKRHRERRVTNDDTN